MSRAKLPQTFLIGSITALGTALLLGSSYQHVRAGAVDLETLVPARFAGWQEMANPVQTVDPSISGDGADKDALYDHITTRSYRGADGTMVVLTLAYRRVQLEESKIHRPELCYFAQGFALSDKARVPVTLATGPFDALSFVATREDEAETVLYVIRIGDETSASAWQTRLRLIGLSLQGVVPDGILIRASIINPQRPNEARLADNRRALGKFFNALAQAPTADKRWILTGGKGAFSQLN